MEEVFGNILERATAELLKEALALDYTQALNEAHRSLQPRLKDGDIQRPIIVKFHYFQERADVLQKAMNAGPITHNGKRFSRLPRLLDRRQKKESSHH